jgi:hypothetical protein
MPMARSFSETFERLKALLVAESEALRLGGATDLAANADAKARILLELTQWRNIGDETALTGDDASALVVLLNDNARLLERHMAAANRIAATLAQHLRDADSDGTYGAGYGAARRGYSA